MHAPRSYRARSLTIAMTPMIDMAFLLITFFVMSIRLVRIGEEKVTLPRADQARLVTATRAGIATIIVPPDGHILLNGAAVELSSLNAALGDLVRDDADLRVMIRGDAGGQFGLIRAVLRASALAGVKRVEFSVLKEARPPAGKKGRER